MQVTVKLFANLRENRELKYEQEVAADATPRSIAQSLAIAPEEVAIVMVNGRRVEPDAALAEGDTVALFPPVGGG